MIKQSFQIRDINNSYVRSLLNKVGKLAADSGKSAGLDYDVLIIEDFGTTVRQNSWTDDTGYFVTYRRHPLYSSSSKMKVAVEMFERGLNSLFCKTASKQFDESDMKNNVTLSWVTASISIGD